MRRLAELSGPQIDERITPSSIVIQPIGAIEQHGPHLPLVVDHLIADAAASTVVERFGDELDLWLLPSQPVGKSNEHAWSAGTLWVSATTLLAMVDDIARSIATTSARKLVFLNGPRGQQLAAECGLSGDPSGARVGDVPPPSVRATRQGGASPEAEMGMGIHGGHMETSVMLHLRPDLVDMSKATRNVPAHLAGNEHVRFGGTATFGWLSNDFGPDGHIGDPTTATAAEGARLFDMAVEFLGAQLREVRDFTFGG